MEDTLSLFRGREWKGQALRAPPGESAACPDELILNTLLAPLSFEK